jgi:hypothetical protein
VKTKQRDQEQDRTASQLETNTTAAFSVLRVAKERNDLDLTLRTVEAIANLVELGGRMVGTFLKAASEKVSTNGDAGVHSGEESIAPEGGGGHG